MNKIIWTRKKPKLKRNGKEFLLLVAVKIRDEWEYSVYQIKKLEFDEHWYWGVLTEDGDEWGAYEDLTAQLYCTLPLLDKNRKV